MGRAIARRPLTAFFVLTFTLTWGLGALTAVLNPSLAAQAVILEVAGAGPSLAAVVVAAAVGGRTGLRTLAARMLRWRVALRWYLFVLVVVPALLLVAQAGALTASGQPFVTAVPWWALPLVFPLVLLLGPLQEEVGWRGWALPSLLQRMGWLPAGIVLGLVWALWHRTPNTWAWITWDDPWGPEGLAGLVLTAVVPDIALSVTMAWVFLRTNGSGLLAGLGLHTAANFALFVPEPTLGPEDLAARWAVSWAVTATLSALALAAAVLEAYRSRRRPARSTAR